MLQQKLLSEQRDSARQIWDLTISNRSLTIIVSMQTAQLDWMEQMFQTHLNNTQMACRTSAPRRTKAPSLSAQVMWDQVQWAPSPRRGAGVSRFPNRPARTQRTVRGSEYPGNSGITSRPVQSASSYSTTVATMSIEFKIRFSVTVQLWPALQHNLGWHCNWPGSTKLCQGGPSGPSFRVRGFRSRRSHMEDVD